MGVWRRSPAGRTIAMADAGRMAAYREVLPDLAPADIVGSPYCIRDYVVDERLGGPDGLAAARSQLARRGLRLILDFVPNHVAPDHPWATEAELVVAGTEEDLARDPGSYLRVGQRVLACGRDPSYPAWQDVVQVDAFSPALRDAAATTLVDILDQCDGVRCDMAMLLLNDVFARTWGARVGPSPEAEYWTEIIGRIRAAHPAALLVAEAYWDLEWRLQQLGFDACYDKRLYDRLRDGDAEAVRLHLCADLAYQRRLVRFIENHDEPRAAATFAGDRHRAAAVTAMTLPGVRLLHDGQAEGRRVHVPVVLGRAPDEAPDTGLAAWYARLLAFATRPAVRDGRWTLCERSGWTGNDHWTRLVAWAWETGPERTLVVVNLGGEPACGHVRVPPGWSDLRGRPVELEDPVGEARYRRTGGELLGGLYVELAPWAAHLFTIRPARVVEPGRPPAPADPATPA
jgi:hypothetical protein